MGVRSLILGAICTLCLSSGLEASEWFVVDPPTLARRNPCNCTVEYRKGVLRWTLIDVPCVVQRGGRFIGHGIHSGGVFVHDLFCPCRLCRPRPIPHWRSYSIFGGLRRYR